MKLFAHILAIGLMAIGAIAEPFAQRGYYITFMRMPVMESADWKAAVDCFAKDEINTLILWTAGGFRSKKFSVTWEYNKDHANVEKDFLRELIDYAHERKVRVLLGFTPFGYDGVNRAGFEKPDWKARKADGTPVDQFGIHSWGWNLCASKPEAQRFMREYVSEMLFDFYPNADGVLIESSDYNICRCADCGARYYDREFEFVRWISDEIWKRNSKAQILVYPHYFTGKQVPGMNATAAKQPFDSRWSLFFTPHSAHFDPELISIASGSVYSDDSPALRNPERISAAARAARGHGVSGYIPSFEAFSYVTQQVETREPSQVGIRRKPFGTELRMPYDFLLARVQRIAFREFSMNPELAFAEFLQRLGRRLGTDSTADVLEFQGIWNFENDWYWASPLLDPEFFRIRARRQNWPQEKRAAYNRNLQRLKAIAEAHANSASPVEREMARHAREIVDRWADKSPLSQD